MRAEAYLRIVADKATIQAIARKTGPATGRILQTKAKRPASDETWWNWESARIPVDIDNTDESLKGLLLGHRRNFAAFQEHQAEVDIYLELVTRCEPGEEPGGLFLSAETIRLLSEMGGALDHDVVCK